MDKEGKDKASPNALAAMIPCYLSSIRRKIREREKEEKQTLSNNISHVCLRLYFLRLAESSEGKLTLRPTSQTQRVNPRTFH